MAKPLRDITFDPERQEELERLYGPVATSWDRVRCWDDVVTPAEKSLVSELESENTGKPRCPFLGEEGNYFFYCKLRAQRYKEGGFEESKEFTANDPRYRAKVSHIDLQRRCMCGAEENKKCPDLRGASA